jgi:sugar phosphate isomerase/epimerase
MGKLKVGVMVESFRAGVKGGLEKAAGLELDGVQIYCTKGELHPDNMGSSARRDFRKTLAGHNLVLSALCADFGKGFTDADRNDELVPVTKKCVDLALDLGTSIITTHIGVIPEDKGAPVRGVMAEALKDLGAYAAEREVSFATETGPESPECMREFLDSLGNEGVRVNYDPANLTMKGFDAVAGVGVLSDLIVHTHAKDGKQGGGEVALGSGDVKWEEYIAALEGVGFDGFFTIEREVGDNPEDDIRIAAEFLRGF